MRGHYLDVSGPMRVVQPDLVCQGGAVVCGILGLAGDVDVTGRGEADSDERD